MSTLVLVVEAGQAPATTLHDNGEQRGRLHLLASTGAGGLDAVAERRPDPVLIRA